MARGTAEPGTFLFLNQPARIRAWAALLGQTRMAEPTRQHYLKNVAQFLDYLSETPPAACRLSSTTLVLIRREVRALFRGIRRRVVVHEVRTKQAKESRLIPKASLVRCHRTAGRKIPALLDSLESNPSTRQQWRFYGFLTGYLTSISGHRCGVFQNLTIQEVEEASRSPDESAYVINAKNAHSSEDRRKVAQFMCHDTSTSDKRMGRQRALKAPRGKGARGQRLPSLPWREPAGGCCHGALPGRKARALAHSNQQKTLNRPE
nr:uncharacterized protein LOC108182242 [Danio rerio]|eukprot:XP_021326528.1 uncharacterized protein LOC108182242 [Danio rerio]